MAIPPEQPTNPAEALGWVKEALAKGHYIIDTHYYKRCQERRISPRAWRRVIETAVSCATYVPKGGPLVGGTCWRIVGMDFMEKETTIGVETFRDHLGRRVLVVTTF